VIRTFMNRLALAGVIATILLVQGPASAATFDLSSASIADINAAFDAGALSSEKLVGLCLARIKAYDQAGPRVNAIIAVNPKALEYARVLDAERKAKGPRSPLHGVPIVLKDNYDTFDMPTTGGSKALVGSIAPDDAFVVAKLRAAGAVIIAKANLSELARSGVTISSLLGQTLNPYDLKRTPGGSSGGTGVAVAAVFGIVGTGSDTGQSTRSPASANNGVGIRPTFGLISRDGIIPISYTQDTAGPIAHYVADAAIMMDYMVGFDASDTSTWAGVGKVPKSYSATLDANSLKGKRIGYVTNLFGDGSHPEHAVVKAVTMKSIDVMRAQGAEVLPLDIPEANHDGGVLSVGEFEGKWQMDEYFASLGPQGKYHNLSEYVAAAGDTNPAVLKSLKQALTVKNARHDPELGKRLERQAQFRESLLLVMTKNKLDALFFTHQRRLVVPASPDADQVERNGFMASSTGLPAITLPGGFSPPTKDAPIGVPVGVEFLGRPFSEAQLINLAYGLEQAMRHRRLPQSTPPLPGEKFEY
jgi:amidase